MPRPSSSVDIEMIKAGRMIIESEGVEAVTIRNVCSLASVNIGLFNYYFSTKENFFIKLLDNIYEEFNDFAKLDLYSLGSGDECINSLYKLRYCLNKMLQFVIDKEKLMVSIFYDLLLKNRCFLEKVGTNYLNKHILLKLIKGCIEEGYFSTGLPPVEIFNMFVLGGFGFQYSSFSQGFDSNNREERAKFRKERVNIILNGLLNKGDKL